MFTVTAEDQYGNPSGSLYSGIVQFGSSDTSALLPAAAALVDGTGTFSATLESPGIQTISASDSTAPGLTGTTGTIIVSTLTTRFSVVPSTTQIAAGSYLSVTVTAQDDHGHTDTGYTGTVQLTDGGNGNALLPAGVTLNQGVGTFAVALTMVSQTSIVATQVGAPAITGSSVPIMVVAGPATSFLITAPAGTQITGAPFNVTVQALDQFGNLATNYAGTIALTSTDPTAATIVASYPFTIGPGGDDGSHVFGVTLNTAGSQKIMATDPLTTNPKVSGTSSAIVVQGLIVTSFAPTPDGFTVTFNKPIVPADLALYGLNSAMVPVVKMVGNKGVGNIHGSLVPGPSNQSVTFKATSSYLQQINSFVFGKDSVVLPDATYQVTLASGNSSQGFLDALGTNLDGANDGSHANYVTTFTTHYQMNSAPVLGIPDFARGPDSNTPIEVPNGGVANGGSDGIPITLYNAAGVTDVTFTLTYNPALLGVNGTLQGNNSDATDSNGVFTLITNAGGVATFDFHDSMAQTGTVVLGDVVAVVPDAANNLYQATERLVLGNIVINGGDVGGAVAVSGLHVNAYLGDVNADRKITGLDHLIVDNVAQGRASGFSQFPALDPAIIGDPAGDNSVDAGDVSLLDAYIVQLHPSANPGAPLNE